ncbi:MAG: orange carotenoid protein N-terminal domain-containing protein [Coleofasciculus sp. C1-SOL-03]|uniref:orange carotenoid protein N-terminal domain-containing protein n=1 Tax=Coleofasciculus sp. C1-SOL-03 TaxID=3069522 RepID=UPI0032FC1602
MASTQPTGVNPARSEETKNITQAFEGLGTDDKLALLYYIYEKMGDSITPAAPTAADAEISPQLLRDFYNLSDDQQLTAMREIVNCQDTQVSRAYGALSENNQLLVWYAWAQGMGDTVVDMPLDYKAQSEVNSILSQIENLDFEGQISLLRQVAGDMGYSIVEPVPSQEETGKTPSL